MNTNDMDYTQKRQRCGEYIESLEEERRKILVFQRELPLCLELVTQAIEACKREISGTTTVNVNGQSECSEQTTGECGGPMLEEFIPIKHSFSSQEYGKDDDDNDDDEHESHESNDNNTKSDWLKSVQLWSPPDPTTKEMGLQEKETVVEVKRNDVTFQPFHQFACGKSSGEENKKTPATAVLNSGGRGEDGMKKETEKDGGKQRKLRRCWSQDLHRRFLNALQQLGGAHVATPKQIRELMKVDGLTNDEVKSHLQKYRLHTRRPSQKVPDNENHQTSHFVVVGGLWVPQPDYSTAKSAAAAATTTTGIYGPMMAPSPQKWTNHSNNFGPSSKDRCHVGGAGRCGSPAMSSSTRPNVKDGKIS